MIPWTESRLRKWVICTLQIEKHCFRHFASEAYAFVHIDSQKQKRVTV